MRAAVAVLACRTLLPFCLAIAGGWSQAQPALAQPADATQVTTEITNLLQIRQLDFSTVKVSYPVSLDLEGQVGWVGPERAQLALLEPSGQGVRLELDGQEQAVRLGQRVRLRGTGNLSRRGDHFAVGNRLELNNDGQHPMREKSAGTFLKAGRRPICVEWFNAEVGFGLGLEYEGPDLPRRSVGAAELFRNQNGDDADAHGLNYRVYEGAWQSLPDFNRMIPVKSGTCASLDLGVRTRDQRVGIQYTGFLQIPRDGFYHFYLSSDDGSRLLIGEPDASSVQLEILGDSELPKPRRLAVGEMMGREEDGLWAEVAGRVSGVNRATNGVRLELSVGLARMEAEVADLEPSAASGLVNGLVRAVGFCQCAYNTDGLKVPSRLLVSSRRNLELLEAPPVAAAATNAAKLPLLTTIGEVKQLKRDEAHQFRPAKLRGVVTSFEGWCLTLQDSTGGILVEGDPVALEARIGEFVEIEGNTGSGTFGPVLWVRRIQHLGEGRLPEPVHPAWDQLMSGSLDCEYAEIKGIVTRVDWTTMQLLVPGGVVKVWSGDFTPEQVKSYENTLVRVRGVLSALSHQETGQVMPGRIHLFAATVIGEQSSPADAFSAPFKTPRELLLFDPQAGFFQKVRSSGQIVHIENGNCFVMTGSNGWRFLARKAPALKPGDMVEVTGYPDLSGASPLLREAFVRKTGHAALPAPVRLPPGDKISAKFDSLPVYVSGVLVGIKGTREESVLEMQDGGVSFVARLRAGRESAVSLPTGCRLGLTGVYSALGGQGVGERIAGFEMLLDSPADIAILERPPWWTLKRLVMATVALLCVLAVAGLWIQQLHRKVEQRTRELAAQIHRREQTEQQRAMEQERSRIARDLHDELGSGLTYIGWISGLAAVESLPEKAGAYSTKVVQQARQMVESLDEIVWAVNPRNDTLNSLAQYLTRYAYECFSPTPIKCRLNIPAGLPDVELPSEIRHNLFLAIKEAFHNVLKHSGATQASLSLALTDSGLAVTIEDNGHGFATDAKPSGRQGHGLENLRRRMGGLGGVYQCESAPGRGTRITLSLSLAVKPADFRSSVDDPQRRES